MTTVQQDALDQVVDGDPDHLFTPPEVCMFAQITYRQLDYWIRIQCVEFDHPDKVRGGGSGTQRRFTVDDVRRIRVLARLVRAGFHLDVACAVARELFDNGFKPVALGDGVWLQVYGR
jgi:hypothetical protein